jgi:hypothetical protein
VVANEGDAVEQSKQWLEMKNGDIKCVPFTFVPSAADIGNEIQVRWAFARSSRTVLIFRIRSNKLVCIRPLEYK